MDTIQGYLFAPGVEFKQLNLSDFQSVVNPFEKRMLGWFFNPIEQLIGNENNFFVITAIECMVVDALSGFWYGDNGSEKNFTKFLVERLNVRSDFAEAFYLRFRNGIVHQTNIKQKSMISTKVKDFQFDSSNVLSFNPIDFYNRLRAYFDQYLTELKSRSNGVDNFKTRFKQLFKEEFSNKEWEQWKNS